MQRLAPEGFSKGVYFHLNDRLTEVRRFYPFQDGEIYATCLPKLTGLTPEASRG